MKSLNFFIALLSLLSLATITKSQDPSYLYHVCSNETTYTRNSTYQANLNLLLSSLVSNATRNNLNGFYNSSIGLDPDDVYGLFLCRGDVSKNACHNCVALAAEEAIQRCPVEKVVILWYDLCLLRYSNRAFFSTMDQDPGVTLVNTQNIADEPERFNRLVATTMNDTATRATSVPSGAKKFAVKEVSFKEFQNLYSLVQCTPDLSSSDCNRCLRIAISTLPSCCSQKPGARVLYPSCNIRYEIYEFYNKTAVAAESPPPPPPEIRAPPPSPVSGSKGKVRVSTVVIIAIVVPVGVSIALFCLGFCFLRRRGRKNRDSVKENDGGDEISTEESLQFDLSTIEAATNNFSPDNKLGEGGFGEVFKGTFPNGQHIAVKRLSKYSGQGAAQFKNEVLLIAKLQHRNLVRLLGYCLQGEEKILIYEFVPNKSLDYFLFDPARQGLLDWLSRYKIIGGIARGLLYLHEDSRLRIIHRDLKASNVLLDGEMNARIADFGMAKIFGVDQTQGVTSRIAGTFGYMAPEYAMQGQYSVKSDVYSFGVLILEIISGKKNSSFYQSDNGLCLVNYAWKQWKIGAAMELVDPSLGDSYSRNEITRCLHIALLCVQEDPNDRPTLTSVVLMLTSFSISLPLLREPSSFEQSMTISSLPLTELESDKSNIKSKPLSVNDVSITELYPR
ncbi:cysteine-rich receptor-like protein kinase 10 [Populus alba]|uniref:cysteine-rich receptor-like protein kinase 10 n=1 Tax=Populus alba TaxID=43335 RepID=UPI00158AA021|nr:cysteine-rich receptor-like protein kinase 10 [Populus alba]